MTIAGYIRRMNRRERTLAGALALVVFLLANLFLWSWLINSTRRLRADVAKRKLTRNEQTIFLRDTELWNNRAQWLRAHQPVYKGPADASALLDQLKQVASKYNVLIENPAIGTGAAAAAYQSVFASIETRSPWPPLVHFLYDVQTPESFIVFENINLAVDPSDATQMRGKFRVARWYAPAGVNKPK